MPSKPKLSVKTPDVPDYNSLIEAHSDIVSLPRERRYAIVEIGVPKVMTDVDSGEHQATLQLVHIEHPLSSADEKKVVDLLDTMYRKRTSSSSRPNPNREEDTPLDGISTLDDEPEGA